MRSKPSSRQVFPRWSRNGARRTLKYGSYSKLKRRIKASNYIVLSTYSASINDRSIYRIRSNAIKISRITATIKHACNYYRLASFSSCRSIRTCLQILERKKTYVPTLPRLAEPQVGRYRGRPFGPWDVHPVSGWQAYPVKYSPRYG